jgi:hypothetical protein
LVDKVIHVCGRVVWHTICWVSKLSCNILETQVALLDFEPSFQEWILVHCCEHVIHI